MLTLWPGGVCIGEGGGTAYFRLGRLFVNNYYVLPVTSCSA